MKSSGEWRAAESSECCGVMSRHAVRQYSPHSTRVTVSSSSLDTKVELNVITTDMILAGVYYKYCHEFELPVSNSCTCTL